MDLEKILNERSERAEKEKQQAQQQAETEKQQDQQETQQETEGWATNVEKDSGRQVFLENERKVAEDKRKEFAIKKEEDLGKIKALRVKLGLEGEGVEGMGFTDEEKEAVLAELATSERGEKEAQLTHDEKSGEINAINKNTEKTVGDADIMDKIHEDALKKDGELNKQKEEQEEAKIQSLEEEDQKLSPEEKDAKEDELLAQLGDLIKRQEMGKEFDKDEVEKKIERLRTRIFRLGGAVAQESIGAEQKEADEKNNEFDRPKRKLEWEKNHQQGIAMDEDKIFDKYKTMSPEERDAIEKELIVKLEEVKQRIEELKKQEKEALDWSQASKIKDSREHLENFDFYDLSREIKMLKMASGAEQQTSNPAS